ncbi:MAG: hypothetical protein Q9207_008258 [Kuettlingeria erythrocarpa]
MRTPLAFQGVSRAFLLSLGLISLLLFSKYRGVSKPSHAPSVANQDLQPLVSPHHELLIKRDAAADYAAAVIAGEQMWTKIQAAFDGCPRDLVPNFQPSDLDNGWTKTTLNIALDAPWRAYIDLELGPGKVPPADQTSFIELTQDKPFKNKQGGMRPALSTTGLEPARYRTYHIPPASAIIIKNMRSPATVVKEIFKQANQPNPPSNAAITNIYTPPLSRWSDVAWTVYAELAAATASTTQKEKLQFVGHDQVNNAFTAGVMFTVPRHGLWRGDGRGEGVAGDAEWNGDGLVVV